MVHLRPVVAPKASYGLARIHLKAPPVRTAVICRPCSDLIFLLPFLSQKTLGMHPRWSSCCRRLQLSTAENPNTMPGKCNMCNCMSKYVKMTCGKCKMQKDAKGVSRVTSHSRWCKHTWVARIDCMPRGALLAKWEEHGKTCGEWCECERKLGASSASSEEMAWGKGTPSRSHSIHSFEFLIVSVQLSLLMSSVSAPLWNSLYHFGSSWSYLELGHILKSSYGTKNGQVPAQPDVRMQSYNIWFQVTSGRMPFGQTLETRFRGNF